MARRTSGRKDQRPRAPAPVAIPAAAPTATPATAPTATPATAPTATPAPLPPDGTDRLVDTDEAAMIISVTSKWLKDDRKRWKGKKKGYGPPFIRIGPRLVRYSVRAILDWAVANTVNSGSAA